MRKIIISFCILFAASPAANAWDVVVLPTPPF